MPANPKDRRITPAFETYYDFVPRKNAYPVPTPGIFDEPGTCVQINNEWLPYLIGVIDILRYKEFWTGDQYHAEQEIEKLIAALTDTCTPVIPVGGGGDIYLPDCIDTEQGENNFTINIQECCDMTVIVNINENCGCGCGDSSAQQFGGGGSLGIGGAGGSWGNSTGENVTGLTQGNVTPCDAATTFIPYLFQQAREFVLAVQVQVTAGSILLDAITTAASQIPIIGAISEATAQTMIDELDNCLDDAVNALIDSDLIEQGQIEFIRSWGNNTQIQSIGRGELFVWAHGLPRIWGNILDGCIFLPRQFMKTFINFVDMTKLNSRLANSAGTSTSETQCDFWYANAGAIKPATGTVGVVAGANEVISVTPDLDIYVYNWAAGEKQLTVAPSSFDIATHDNIVMVATYMQSPVSNGVQVFQSFVNGNMWMEYDADVGQNGWHDFRGVATYFAAFKQAMPDYAGVVGAQPAFAPDSGLVQIWQNTNTGNSQIIDLLQVAIMVDKSL